jgi:hypothetical protein
MKIQWGKVLANGGLAFFTALTGLGTVDTIFNIDMSLDVYLLASFFVAGIQGCVAIFRDICEQYELNTRIKFNKRSNMRGSCSATCKVFGYLLMF